MQFYSLDDIKKAGNCVEYMRQQGYKPVKPNFFNIPWRANSDSGALHVQPDKWYDHVQKEGGSIIDMAMRIHGYDIMEAAEHLGKLYNLQAREPSIITQRRVVKEYVYTDENGDAKHKTVRTDPKDFFQYRLEAGEWKLGLEDIRTYMFNLPNIIKQDTVYITEGEADAETLMALGLPATTVPMGANKWRDDYTPYFINKNVIIVRDNDDPGEIHANRIAWELRSVAKSIQGVCPSTKSKGDVTDYFKEEGGTLDAFLALCKEATLLNVSQEPVASIKEDDEKQLQKFNKTPFRNYKWLDMPKENGDTKREKVPTPIKELTEEVFGRCGNFPKSVGGSLFYWNRKRKRIRFLNNAEELFAFIAERTGHNVSWARQEGCTTKPELFASVAASCERYEAISGVPTFPKRKDIFYAHEDLPEPSPDAKHFHSLIGFFDPATEEDKLLLRTMFATPIYWRNKVERPVWVIDSTTGPGAGKTKLIEMLALLYGVEGEPSSCEPILVDSDQLSNETGYDRVQRRLLSGAGRQKKIFLLDNVVGFFSSSQLASMITIGAFSGMSPYARGEETRPNDLTYCVTSNNATMDKDMIVRSFFINLRHPQRDVRAWSTQITEYIEAHRLKIFSEIMMLLQQGAQFDFHPVTRFKDWECEIAAPILQTFENFSAVIKCNSDRAATADGELERADIIRDYFREQIHEMGLDPDNDMIWLQSGLIRQWCTDAIPGFGGRNGNGIMYLLKGFMRNGSIYELSDEIKKYPHRGPKQKRGLAWNYERYMLEKKSGGRPNMTIFKLDNKNQTMIDNESGYMYKSNDSF